MLSAVFSAAILFSDATDPIQAAIDYYEKVTAYQVSLRSTSGGRSEVIRYYFKKPGYVRMEFLRPFRGAVLVYSPVTKRAKLWPFGYRSFPSLTLSADNSLIQSSTGQRIDRSDVGVLYHNVKALQEHGRTQIVGMESVGGQKVLHLTVEGNRGFSVGSISRYQLWLDQTTGFPLKGFTYGVGGRLIEIVETGELKITADLPDDLFNK